MTEIRELSLDEVDAVSGAFPPVVAYYGLRTGGGALIGVGIGPWRALGAGRMSPS